MLMFVLYFKLVLHLLYRLLETENEDIGQDLESTKRMMASKPLDPSSIDPLYRSRLKKQTKLLATSDKNEVKQTYFWSQYS